ncbi:MAG: D-alanine--D-alanine ligase [Gemmatimonadetes bacterium]|jgi:D-alanine-D-alanine ligase|nr:D-alanine--D-alanine ligase [Gemmatimonadota bacterium]MBT7859399.1 D-alanine--D-alanine ligase [Gemmatimonadota bacterium]
MPEKIRVGVLFGGRSAEHEVSVTSARSVLAAIDRDKYDVTMIGIDRDGRWLSASDAQKLLGSAQVAGDDHMLVRLDYTGSGELVAGDGSAIGSGGLDVVLPILHGPFGEDGTVQGLLALAGVACVGSGVLGSAVGMDKDMMKRVFRDAGLPQVDYRCVLRSRWQTAQGDVVADIETHFDYPVFIKPANLGSSVGISKAHDRAELIQGMDEAANYDRKLIIEANATDCREIEAAVLGNDDPDVATLGEVVPGNEFYDYRSKYIDDNSQLLIPAPLAQETTQRLQQMARDAFLAVDAAGLSRVDFFVGRDDESRIYINEINTLPGFTPISMYPKLWDASGVPYAELIDRLIGLAIERHRESVDVSTDRGLEAAE